MVVGGQAICDPPPAIAVIGLACRLPGARDAASYWELVERGGCAIVRLQEDELLHSGVSPELVGDPAYVPVMGVLDEAEAFDATFFGISPQEAVLTDPQHRLFLQTVWHALEDAGCDPHRGGHRIGCFGGAGMSLYAGRRMSCYATHNLLSHPTLADGIIAPQLTVGNRHDYLATKTAYKLGLRGPALSLHTACSTGLVAVHLARASLLLDECDVAVAGAAAIPAPSRCGYRFDGGLLSPTGECRPFDSRANGTVGGAGVAIVVLKRLDRAIADGDRIRAVILASAINNDGADKVSYLSPGFGGQVSVIRAALASAAVEPATIGYVETHGTGTPHGDPIEFSGLSDAYGAAGAGERWRCALGAAKANIGHLDTAAGAAGIIKAILALEHGIVPPVAGLEKPNPALDLDGSAFYLPRQSGPWPVAGVHPRRAAVSSFGAGGTNAHMILEAPARVDALAADEPVPAALLLSAKTADALASLARRGAAILGECGDPWPAVAATSQSRRHHFAERCAIIAGNCTEAAAGCSTYAREERSARIIRSSALTGYGGEPIVFLFAGQGQLDVALTRSLHRRFAPFAEAFDRTSELIAAADGPDLGAAVSGSAAIEGATWAQPFQYAFGEALARLWMAAGIRPALAIGHSLGEIAAAAIAGIFDPESAARIVVARGRLMDQFCAEGGMIAVQASRARCEEEVAAGGFEGLLSVSVMNAPEATVLSGPREACRRFAEYARAQSLSCLSLPVTHGFHSAAMDAMLEPFTAVVQAQHLRPGDIATLPTSAGGGSLEDPQYWVRQLRDPVDFASAAATLLDAQPWISVEIGAGATLTTFLERIAGEGAAPDALASAVAAGHRGEAAFLHGLATLHCRGMEIAWDRLSPSLRAAPAALPAYPFRTERFCQEPGTPRGEPPAREPQPAAWRLAADVVPLPSLPSAAAGEVVLVASADGALARRAGAGAAAHVIDPRDLDGSGCGGLEALSRASASLAAPTIVVDALGASESPDVGSWRSYAATLTLLGAIQSGRVAASLCIATNGGASAGCADATTLRAEALALWALARTARLELPDARIGCIDLAADESAMLDRLLLGLADASPGEALIRGGRAFAPAWRTMAMADGEDEAICRKDACYLVTGGTSGFGLAAAERLAARGARSLILVSRGRNRDPAFEERRTALASAGVEVGVLGVDIGSAEARDFLVRYLAGRPPLRGILHAAGCLADRLLLNQSTELLAEVAHAKLVGFANLVSAVRDLGAELDFLLAFSSLAAPIGSPAQSNYAAANAALEAMVAGGRRDGLPATLVHWGPLAGIGMNARLGEGGRAVPAIAPLPAEAALDALETVLRAPPPGPVVIAGAADWPPAGAEAASETLAARLWSRAAVGAPAEIVPAAPGPLDRQRLQAIVQEEVARIAGGAAAEVATDLPFADLGIDSLAGLQLRHGLAERLDLRLPPTLIFECPTVAHLAARLVDTLDTPTGDEVAASAEVAAAVRALERELEALAEPSAATEVQRGMAPWL